MEVAATPAGTDWLDSPITPGWVLTGSPRARWRSLARSADGFSHTAMWDCTAGTFRWHYDEDETVHIVDGEVVITADGDPPRTLRPGDVHLFAAGTAWHWSVPRYVRKIAFFHRPVPRPAALALHALHRLRRRAA